MEPRKPGTYDRKRKHDPTPPSSASTAASSSATDTLIKVIADKDEHIAKLLATIASLEDTVQVQKDELDLNLTELIRLRKLKDMVYSPQATSI